MEKQVTCIARFVARKGKTEQLKESLLKLIEPTRKEDGCLSYALHVNMENVNCFTMIEEFKSKEAFNLHGKQPYLEEFKSIVSELAESVSITLYKKV